MIKIFFTNNWNENDNILNKRICTTTPGNTGIWKNLTICDKIEDAHFIISLGGLNKKLKVPLHRIIILQREPDILSKFIIYHSLSYSYQKLIHAWTHPEHMQMNWDDFHRLPYTSEDKKLRFSTITSMRLHSPDCVKRVNFITKFCKKYPGVLDVYGAEWDDRLGSDYQGELPFHNLNTDNDRLQETPKQSKYQGLKNYRYSLCIENSSYPNYFTEKITDCLLSWCIPIYYGCPNIHKFFPRKSYYWIDINHENSIDKLYHIIQKPIDSDNILALSQARKLIMEKYNIWELTHRIIGTIHK